MEALVDFGGIGDDHRDTAGAQQMPQPDLAADAVTVGVDVRRQNDVAGAGECRRHVPRRLGTIRWNRNAVRVHWGEDNRLLSGADLAPWDVFDRRRCCSTCLPARRLASRRPTPTTTPTHARRPARTTRQLFLQAAVFPAVPEVDDEADE